MVDTSLGEVHLFSRDTVSVMSRIPHVVQSKSDNYKQTSKEMKTPVLNPAWGHRQPSDETL